MIIFDRLSNKIFELSNKAEIIANSIGGAGIVSIIFNRLHIDQGQLIL
jgi:hypothetical protein